MEVTRQLLAERASKKGLARIQLTFCWDGHRLRLSSGQKVLPADWDAKRERAKPRPGNAYLDEVNAVLNRYTDAATAAELAALQAGQHLDKPAMQAAIAARYRALAAAAAGLPEVPPPPAPPPPTFAQHYAQWLGGLHRKTSLTTGDKLSKSYLDSLANSLALFEAFAAHSKTDLATAAVGDAWYEQFQGYFFAHRSTELNTFGKHIGHLKRFLRWATRRGLPTNPQFLDFAAPDVPTGTDFLSQAELLALAAADFFTDRARAHVRAAFEAMAPPADSPRRNGQRRSQADDYRVLERLRMLDQARDKLLQCCYLGLRISDADKVGWRHVHGDVARVHAGKNRTLCVIPFFDDDVFRPVALAEKYRARQLPTLLPHSSSLSDYLPTVAALAGITRIALTSKVGRKTFATLKVGQGVPRATVMMATGHRTEKSFNRYLGIDEDDLVATFRKTARTVAKKGGTAAPTLAEAGAARPLKVA